MRGAVGMWSGSRVGEGGWVGREMRFPLSGTSCRAPVSDTARPGDRERHRHLVE